MTLISKGYIHITADKFPVLKLTSKSQEILKGKVRFYHKKDLLKAKLSKEEALTADEINKNFDKDLFNRLKEIRLNIAQQKGMPPYIVFHDSSLKEMATYLPQNQDEFLNIKGAGHKKYENYGKDFIGLINDYILEKDLNVAEIRRKSLTDTSTQMGNNIKADRYELTYDCYREGLS